VPCRIIGCGNTDRGDDAAGLLVAQRLRDFGVDACDHIGDGLSLIERWRGQDEVILIDAVITGGTAGAITVWDAGQAAILHDFPQSSTHGFGVCEAVKLSRVLDCMPERMLIYGIEGQCFEAGCNPLPEVLTACEQLARHLAARNGVV